MSKNWKDGKQYFSYQHHRTIVSPHGIAKGSADSPEYLLAKLLWHETEETQDLTDY